ncbi:uncharacterized protein AC631_00592 [Debaryomyces fabryi]|uniref:Uncharacterized protein n=1 Tax=Debaryomyces fabryi TaxID=58627 RepID=A0A0V1Q540_9ASCO|nr:uncharacterized protein AC631_00592 [Debaryomyces fabryi]KSA03617.1 hypothetical protein AC631_00592 [Debaryomyces fabryi]CUM52718.1 unnamed protein product [Debaryomyces fabryi]
MVSISTLLHGGFLLVGQSAYQDVASPQQASVEQYNIVRFLGGAGPYIQNPGHGISTDVPDQCTVEQVQLILRHGERFPSSSAGKKYEDIMQKFEDYNGTFSGQLSFLNDYTYFVSNKDLYELEVSPSNSRSPYAGTTNALKHGAAFRARYDSLYNPSNAIPVFTTSNTRVYETSQSFIRGFLGQEYDESKVDTVILSESSEMGANSLTPASACSAWDSEESENILSHYSNDYLDSALKRLLKPNPGLNLTTDDVYNMFGWCAYELNVKGESPFCELFTNEEFIKYEYSVDLSDYYSDGPGNSVIKPIGSVLLNASLQLLKDEDLSNKIYVSFTHDTDITNYICGGLGLFEPENPLPADHIPFFNPYVRSHIVPQGARVYTEKLKCSNGSYVRYIVNDSVIPINNCTSGPGFSCGMDQFEDIVKTRLEGVDYAKLCKIGNATSDLTFFWDYTKVKYNAPLKKASY